MNDVLRLACEYSLLLVCGSTLLLGMGCLAVAACRSPAHRQRLAELTVGGILVWLVLTLMPLPRFASPLLRVLGEAASNANVPAFPAPLDQALSAESPVVSESFLQADPLPSIPIELEPSNLIVPPDPEASFPLLNNAEASPAVLTIAEDETRSPLPVPSPTQSWLAAPSFCLILVSLYMIGAAACAALLLIGHGLLLWIRLSGQRPPAWLDTDYQQFACKAHVPAAELLVSQRCSRPISWGLLRPAIVLPDRLCREANRRLVATVLLHELGHVARRDAWGNLLFCLASPLLYCHPLYWWLRREWNLAAELVADDWAAWQTGKDAYVEELMDLARTSPASGFPFVGVTAVFSSPSQFYRRMQMLLVREQPLSTRTSVMWQVASIAVAVLGIVLASSLGGVRPAIAQDKPALPGEVPPAVEAPAIDPSPALPGEPPAAGPQPPAVPDPPQPPQPPSPGELPRDPFAPEGNGVPTVPALPDPAHRNATAAKPEAQDQAAAIRELRAEQAQLEARLQALQARLKELGGVPYTTANPGKRKSKLEANTKEYVTLTRVDKDGAVWNELWTIDERGQTQKLIQREAAGKLPVNVETEPTADGKIVKTFEGKDGSTVHVYDSRTGKLIETRQEKARGKREKPRTNRDPLATPEKLENPTLQPNNPLEPPSAGTAKPLPSISVALQAGLPSLPAAETAPAITPANPAVRGTTNNSLPTTRVQERSQGSSGRELDLLALATSYADAVGSLEATQAKLADIEAVEAKSSGTVPKQEITSARLAVAAAQRKEQLLQRIAKVALESVSKELDRATQLHKNGIATASDMEEAQTRMEILKQILSTQAGSERSESPGSSSSGQRK